MTLRNALGEKKKRKLMASLLRNSIRHDQYLRHKSVFPIPALSVKEKWQIYSLSFYVLVWRNLDSSMIAVIWTKEAFEQLAKITPQIKPLHLKR